MPNPYSTLGDGGLGTPPPGAYPSPNLAASLGQAPAGGNPTPAGMPGAGQTGYFDVPNPFESATGAATRALRNLGYNPGSFHPAIRQVLAKAGALANELALTLADDPSLAGDASKALGAFTSMIQSGLSGGKIFGGKTDALGRLSSMAQQAEGLGGADTSPASQGLRFIAQLLSDPDRAATLFAQANYGGAPKQFQQAQLGGLNSIADQYMQMLEQQGPKAPLNLLDVLLGRQSSASNTGSMGTLASLQAMGQSPGSQQLPQGFSGYGQGYPGR